MSNTEFVGERKNIS